MPTIPGSLSPDRAAWRAAWILYRYGYQSPTTTARNDFNGRARTWLAVAGGLGLLVLYVLPLTPFSFLTMATKPRNIRYPEFSQLKQLMADVEEDVEKRDAGNAAAGTRVRKAMQALKVGAQGIRETVVQK